MQAPPPLQGPPTWDMYAPGGGMTTQGPPPVPVVPPGSQGAGQKPPWLQMRPEVVVDQGGGPGFNARGSQGPPGGRGPGGMGGTKPGGQMSASFGVPNANDPSTWGTMPPEWGGVNPGLQGSLPGGSQGPQLPFQLDQSQFGDQSYWDGLHQQIGQNYELGGQREYMRGLLAQQEMANNPLLQGDSAWRNQHLQGFMDNMGQMPMQQGPAKQGPDLFNRPMPGQPGPPQPPVRPGGTRAPQQIFQARPALGEGEGMTKPLDPSMFPQSPGPRPQGPRGNPTSIFSSRPQTSTGKPKLPNSGPYNPGGQTS